MLAYLLIHLLLLVKLVGSNAMIGQGKYHVLSIKKCDGADDSVRFDAEVSRRRYNRTHEYFNSKLMLLDDFDDSYGIRIEICKYVEGGCKLYHVLKDDCMIHFMESYAMDNVHRYLLLAGLNPPDFPMEKGNYSVVNYVYDYTELPDYGLIGTYKAHSVMLRDDHEVGCLDFIVEFKEDQILRK